jgi:hypothetical protein
MQENTEIPLRDVQLPTDLSGFEPLNVAQQHRHALSGGQAFQCFRNLPQQLASAQKAFWCDNLPGGHAANFSGAIAGPSAPAMASKLIMRCSFRARARALLTTMPAIQALSADRPS